MILDRIIKRVPKISQFEEKNSNYSFHMKNPPLLQSGRGHRSRCVSKSKIPIDLPTVPVGIVSLSKGCLHDDIIDIIYVL